MKLGRQDKAKYKNCCLKGILVPKQLFAASQFAHFRQLHGNNNNNNSIWAPFPGAMMGDGRYLWLSQWYSKFKHLLKLC